MKRDPIMQYPYNNSPLTWVVCVLAAIILGIFAFTAFATAVQEHSIIAVVVGLALSYTTYYFSVQAYMWYRYRHAAKEPYLRHAKEEAAYLKEMRLLLTNLFSRHKNK